VHGLAAEIKNPYTALRLNCAHQYNTRPGPASRQGGACGPSQNESRAVEYGHQEKNLIVPPVTELLPHVNATLNAVAAVLLFCGYRLIRQRRILAHRRAMLASFAVSVLFLVCYVVYHAQIQGSRRFPDYPPTSVRAAYYFILLTHVVLAAIVPLLAVRTIYLGLRDRREQHRRLARWTLPIWLYVSVTGVLVYVLLYHLFPARP
jgi:uncharacterized membrane protein YozB (DUF420 family)